MVLYNHGAKAMILPARPGVYLMEHLPTGVFYIGSSTNIQSRIRQHKRNLSLGIHKNPKLQDVCKNWNDMEVRYELCIDGETALDREQELLDNFRNSILLCNVALCSRIPWDMGMPDSVRSKISAFHTGRDYGDAFKQMRREKMLGIPRTDEEKRKLSEALKGRKRPPEVVEKVRLALTGKVRTDETRRRISESKIGLPGSPISIAAMMAAVSIRVIINGITYPSIAEAARQLDIPHGTVKQRCHSRTERFKDWCLE